MELSEYQQKIIHWLLNGKGNGCCNAVAGSGKSTTLKLVAQALKESGVSPAEIKIIVFGKANSQDLITKFGLIWKNSICTLHSAGYTLIKKELDIKNPRNAIVNRDKYKKIGQELELINYRAGGRTFRGKLKENRVLAHDSDFVKLVHLIRLTNQEPTVGNIENLCFHFEIEDVFKHDVLASSIEKVLDLGEEMAIDRKIFDYTDQVWLPVKWNVAQSSWFKPYKFVLIDECQDLNATQLELASMLAGKTGRMLFVGDPRQAIMGFAGADSDSYYNIVRRTKAIELPLSLCYRCPKTHIRLVNKIYPDIPIKATANAKEGTIEQIIEDDLDKYLKPHDLILSRKTNPLVSTCIRLLAKGVSAKIKGKDIGKIIQQELEAIASLGGFEYKRFNDFFEMYKQAKIARLEQMDNSEQIIENLKDRLSALHTIYTARPEANSIEALLKSIDDLFSDEEALVVLSTCHRAKGLEAERVFILNPGDMPMTWENQLEWQEDQEHNLLYVALTRSKDALFIIGEAEWFDASEDTSEELKLITSSETSEDTSEELKLITSSETSEDTSEELKLITSSETSEDTSEEDCRFPFLLDPPEVRSYIAYKIHLKIRELRADQKRSLRETLERRRRNR
ncbi:UvrD-helicase domain-containing protein [Gloeothece verrucosa]|uniref:DNA 3'-5' helicase n=1 Tax=Gloeothece verrucosa (strain PCC 7822) TaxID=497965 RepID=E0UJ62_GLOV7|nr:UvrD-helicase domain-containing protein [Gloeothece verrucosa]ADN15765.1 UvrD/REP helicase [Gloeothece verrucosa PCC 7822]